MTPPTGLVTFLLTDIDGCTALWERTGDWFTLVLGSHHALLRRLFDRHGGYAFKEGSDGFLVAFQNVSDALACAIACQHALRAHPWPSAVGALLVRMALHTGDVQPVAGDYRALALNHAHRILAAGHGRQILCSEATAALLRREPRPGVSLVDLGVYQLRAVIGPYRLFQVNYPGMEQERFPPLKAEVGVPGPAIDL